LVMVNAINVVDDCVATGDVIVDAAPLPPSILNDPTVSGVTLPAAILEPAGVATTEVCNMTGRVT